MKKVFKNIVAWLYIMFFIVQAISILSAFIIQNEFVTSTLPFFRFWNAIGRSIFENWLPFSIIFVMIFVGGVLSSQIKLETNISKHFYNFILLCINLFLCNRLYETIVFQEKIEYISKHFWGVLCFVLAIAIVILVGHALKKAREARNSYTKNPPSHSAAVDDRDEIARNADGLQSNIQDELFMKRYPISYIWLNFKYYLSRKKEIKYQKQAEYHEAKSRAKADAKIEVIKRKYDKKVKSYTSNNSNGKDPNPALGIIAIVAVTVIDVLFIIGFISPGIFGDSFFNSILSKIQETIIASSDFFNEMESPVLNWLIAFGKIFLIAIVFIIINFLIYFIFRVLFYFVFNSKEDGITIKCFSRKLKTFFFGVADSVMRLLLFLPDFLELIEDFLLDIDVDILVRDKFEEFDNQSKDKKSTDAASDQDSSPTQEAASNTDESGEK